jgi:hypothetical protein
MPALKPITIPESHNYLAIFLTLACNLKCSYCINHFGAPGFEKGHLSGEEWVRGLNRIESRPDLPITLQGGEPTIHRDFYHIVNNVKPELNIDLLTNLQFDAKEFMANVRPDRIKRNAPYASIRVSYHPEQMKLEPLVEKTLVLLNAGYSIGIWGVLHPSQADEILKAQEYAKSRGIDFRTKEFLGEHAGKMYGTYKYPAACSGKTDDREVMCKTTELIVGPSGGVYRCHSDLYEGRSPVGNILDPEFQIEEIYRPCKHYGRCNPCDIKVTTNRFQQFGHTSVDIIFPEEEQKKAG